jgi:two-component system, sensor histidine kinase and response regulator
MTRGEPFDLDAALAYMDGDKELFHELVQVFLEESTRQIEQIHTGIANGDAKLVERSAHSIKGSASTFAAKPSTEAARHLEVLGREGKFAEFVPALTALEEELELLRAALMKASDEDLPASGKA